jgi:hypothetical protein
MVDICKCDVNDREKLALFRSRRKEWEKWLSARSRHSIFKQIYNLLWYDTVFRTINEARRIQSDNKSGKTGFNDPLIELFDNGFVATQALAIRRLTDPNFHHPQKAVFSLVRLIDDLSSHSNLFTRQNYICYDGTSYSGLQFEKDGIDWIHWDRKHKNFDMLSGVSPEKRKRNDKIKPAIITRLSKEIKVCDNIRTYVNKYLAHASAPETRIKLKDEQKNITLERLDQCYQAIIMVASFIGGIILYDSSVGGVPTPQFDHLENLDKPMVSTNDIDLLDTFWTQRSQEVANWENVDLKKYFNA